MNQNQPGEKRPDPKEIWQNYAARIERANQSTIIRKRLKQLSEQFAKADPSPLENLVNVEQIHVKQAARILLRLADTPEI